MAQSSKYEITLYDFDGTIYDGDCTVDFYKFCLRQNPLIVLLLPYQLLFMLLYVLGFVTVETMKSKFYIFLRFSDTSDAMCDMFWKRNNKKIMAWYLERRENNDTVVVSASPKFLLERVSEFIDARHIIATVVDRSSGKIIGKNCKGNEKAVRVSKELRDACIVRAYGDTRSDLPMLSLAEQAYMIKSKYPVLVPTNSPKRML